MADKNIYLFDVDGVLIEPNAYHIAIEETVKYFGNLLEIDNFRLDKEDIKELDIMHDVWDITDIAIAGMLDSLIRKNGKKSESKDIHLNLMAYKRLPFEKPNWDKVLNGVTKDTKYPPEEVKNNLMNDRLIQSFLDETRYPFKNWGSKIFQEIILGKEKFMSTYDLPMETNSIESLITKSDKPIITPKNIKRLKNKTVSIYTGRPGAPPEGSQFGYSPECEFALQKVGMEHFPSVSMGYMQWLAEKRRLKTQDLTKPNCTQPAAAIYYAMNPSEDATKVLSEAFKFSNKGGTNRTYQSLDGYKVYVFEDNGPPMEAVAKVSELLKKLGVNITPVGIGVSKSEKKRKLLKKVPITEKVFSNINEALDYVLTKEDN